ncbi:hypothetical protein ACFVY1_10765 [Streptomyces sp. NPDC058293]|uniref:hypothetical protein n=1 Tax=Streptomyces sp. NPDC058293 TaxID=3346429 RepID=UPI0036EF42C4
MRISVYKCAALPPCFALPPLDLDLDLDLDLPNRQAQQQHSYLFDCAYPPRPRRLPARHLRTAQRALRADPGPRTDLTRK